MESLTLKKGMRIYSCASFHGFIIRSLSLARLSTRYQYSGITSANVRVKGKESIMSILDKIAANQLMCSHRISESIYFKLHLRGSQAYPLALTTVARGCLRLVIVIIYNH